MVYLSSLKPILYRSPSLYDLGPSVPVSRTTLKHRGPGSSNTSRCPHRKSGSVWACNNIASSLAGPCCIYDNNIVRMHGEQQQHSRHHAPTAHASLMRNKSASCYNVNDLQAKKASHGKQFVHHELGLSLPGYDARSLTHIQRAKHRASIMWLLAKANDDGRIPAHLRDPFYRDYDGHDVMKPWITQRLANGELYGRALANIYGSPEYSTYSHLQILQHLTRKGVFNEMIALSGEEPINETLLLKTSPVRVNAHMIIIECLLMLFVKEIMIPDKVAEVVARFTGHTYEQLFPDGVGELSSDVEEVALFWINRACTQVNALVEKDYRTELSLQRNGQGDVHDDEEDDVDLDVCPLIPLVEEVTDMCDGCSLLGLLAYYCPDLISYRDICLKQDISITDSIYNHQRVQHFCDTNFSTDICFLSLEDFLYLQESIVPNFLAFIADLLNLFEIQSTPCVAPLYLTLCATDSDYAGEFQPNYPALPTPSEMRARSLKHQTWNDSLDSSSDLFYNQQQSSPSAQLYSNQRGMGKTCNSTNRIAGRRSSFASANGSERTLTGTLDATNRQSSQLEPDFAYLEENGQRANNVTNHSNNNVLDNGQLSAYFSQLSIGNSNANNNKNNVTGDNYYKQQQHAMPASSSSSQQLNHYFESLSQGGGHSTHIKAKANHPNNADNVKSLLSMPTTRRNGGREYSSPENSQAGTSSENSSVAEMCDLNDLNIRQQLSERRKQIELGRARENEKRLSSSANFRQEILKTLKSVDYSEEEEGGGADVVRANDDTELTFEVHELNPMRVGDKKIDNTPETSRYTSTLSNTSTYAKRNLFSASEDLKSSITDLHYANSTRTDTTTKPKQADKFDEHEEEKEGKSKAPSPPVAITSASSTYSNHENITTASTPPTVPTFSSSSLIAESVPRPVEPASEVINSVQAPPAAPPRRSQWGQPMMPLAGQYSHMPQQPPPQPAWSQPGPGYGAEQWYGHPHHPTYVRHGGYPPPTPPHHYPMVPVSGPYNMPLDPASGYTAYPCQENVYMSIGYIPPVPPQPRLSQPAPPPHQPQQIYQNTMAIFSEQQQQAEEERVSPHDQEESEASKAAKAKQEAESFFITFGDDKPARKVVKNVAGSTTTRPKSSGDAQRSGMARAATETRLPGKAKEEQDDEEQRSKALFDVKRTAANIPSVSFVIGAEEDEARQNNKKEEEANPYRAAEVDNPGGNEHEMTKKKELIMRQSLKRRLEQEEKRLQKEAHLAAKREMQREKREIIERKKEEEKAKKAFILEQYKQRKQMEEEMEKNGGMAMPPATSGSVSRSSSTLVLNRTPSSGVMMRNRAGLSSAGGGGTRPRPKSLHATAFNVGGTVGSAAAASGGGRYSASRDEIDLIGRLGASSRPQSSMSSRFDLTLGSPNGMGGYSFADMSSGGGEASLSNWSAAYNGPKLFVKPTQKSNKTLILNAINVVLAGAVNAENNKKVAQVISACDSKHYLILFRNSGLQYRAIYAYYPEREEVVKLDGTGPKVVNNDMIDKFFKYNSGTKSFTPIHTKHLCVTIDAFTIHDHLWKAKQPQLSSNNNLGSSTMLRRFS